MALADIKKHFKDVLKQGRSQIGKVSGLGDNVVLDLGLGGRPFIDSLRKGTKPIIVANNMDEKSNDVVHWEKALKEAIADIKKDMKCGRKLLTWTKTSDKRGIYLVKDNRRKTSILIRFLKDDTGKIANDSSVQAVANGFRNLVYDKWVTVVESDVPNLFVGNALDRDSKMPYTDSKGRKTTKKVSTQIAQKTNISHQKGTTVAELAVKNLRKSKPRVNVKLDTDMLNILEHAEKSMGISWGRSSKQTKEGGFKFETKVITKLEHNESGSKIESDTKGVMEKYERAARDYIQKNMMNPSSPLYGLTHSASKSIKKQITEGTVDNIMQVYLTKSGRPDMRYKVNKKAAAFKEEKRAPKVVKPVKKSKPISNAIKLTAAGQVVRGRPQKKKRKDSSNLLRLQTLINKRLPAQVRRNMGRPALINQTGRFSNSVKLESLRETAGGISGEYTYMTNPYETFENTGNRTWPSGYNPKPLISKSIRDLAIQYTEEKFTFLTRTK